MATFIFVHGSFHGGWCWETVVRRLKDAGRQALAPDLPGMGSDTTPAKEVTLDSTGRFIANLARRQADKVILVGHSLGGVTVSAAAELAPEAVAGLVYVAAVLLPSGGSALGALNGNLPPGISMSGDGALLTTDRIHPRHRYYNGCDEADVVKALERLTPQPVRMMQDQLHITAERFARVPRAYIECRHDNALPLEYQRSLLAEMPCNPVFSMATGHSPFIQDPKTFVEYLLAAEEAFVLAG